MASARASCTGSVGGLNGSRAMKTALTAFILSALALGAGCASEVGPTGTPATGGTTPETTAPATAAPVEKKKYVCESDGDCEMSCMIPGNCCGELCVCKRPYHRDELVAIREANTKKCAKDPLPCPAARTGEVAVATCTAVLGSALAVLQ